jgi:predicted metalloprotease with PDZ domain
MSKNTMEHQDQYYNFYLKGMLFNLCLDIELRSLSNGKTGVKDLMLQLMQRYGLNKSFKDDELFDTITTLTDPSIRDFFRKYVENTTPLPLKAQFEKVGIEMNSTQTKIRKKENRSASQEKLYKNWIGE